MENILFKVERIVNETEFSRTLYLSSTGEKIAYKAGQFLTFILNLYGKEIRRSYSFGSTPGIDDELFITIKRIENGAVSRYFFEHIKEGDTLISLPPSGRFTIEESDDRVYFFIAAGSGITPIFSLLKQLLFQQNNKVILLYQNTDERSSIYRRQIKELQKKFANRFTLVEIFSKPIEAKQPQRLNNHLLEKIITEHISEGEDILFYLCGHLEFMRMAHFTLRVMGYKEEQVKKENFVIDFIPKAPFMDDTSPKSVVIHFNGRTHNIQVAYPHNILEVALKNNIQLPYSCRGGRCSTCTATCISGSIKMSINDVLTDKDLEKGLILTCVGYPETDVELQL
ncbi:MAG TPA: 2Fe-2S iron-sulfur cluster-binding protein [Segetibacter sp.]